MSMKNCHDVIGNWTHDLPTCSAVPQWVLYIKTCLHLWYLTQFFLEWEKLEIKHVEKQRAQCVFKILCKSCVIYEYEKYGRARHSEKCVVGRFRCRANVAECTSTNLDIWYSLLLLGYKPVQHVTVLNTVGSCNILLSIIIIWGHHCICGLLLTKMSLCGAWL